MGQLADAFNVLLSDLREKRDMEIYINDLARTLPEAEAAVSEAAPAEERQVTLLGIELRKTAAPPASFSPTAASDTLDYLTRDFLRISRAVNAQDGRVEAAVGHRLLASFEGQRKSDRALTSVADVVSQARANDQQVAAALVAGPAVSGTITWDNRPRYTLTGTPVEQLEACCGSPAKAVCCCRTRCAKSCARPSKGPASPPREHRSTVSELPLFSLSAESTDLLASPQLAATQVMEGSATETVAPQTLSGIGPGAVLGERFEIRSELGAGGMGVVYKAHDRALGELVVVKMLKQELWGDGERLERLKDELKLARKIAHPNVLRTFDFGDADGYPFISMEFVRGVTLRQILDRSGRLPLSAGLRTARRLCRGLGAAHAQGVLHRDIKPENLIIEATGNVKLMDFGIARPSNGSAPARPAPE